MITLLLFMVWITHAVNHDLPWWMVTIAFAEIIGTFVIKLADKINKS